MPRAWSLGLVLIGLWLVLSGYFKPLLLILGALSVGFVLWLVVVRMKGILDWGDTPVSVMRLVPYMIWLMGEIVVANWDVARRILHPRLAISPRLITVKSTQRGDLARNIYANSITLTPGTVSMDVDGDEIVVHALSAHSAQGLMKGHMDRKVTRLEVSSE